MITELQRFLRPAAGGIYTVSTGTKEQRQIQKRIYGADDDDGIRERWRETLEALKSAEVVLLGVPCDVGAGFVRGANFAPQSIRRFLLRCESWLYREPRIVDAGDVLVVPQLLHDSLLHTQQLAATRQAMYGEATERPVSPLSITEHVIGMIRELNPNARPLLIGGDHSVGWPGLAGVARGREAKTGILHFDAHTDLLEHRLGVRYCFATWAFHANELIGADQRLAQVGLRISGKTREHWESTLGVRQYWMDEMQARPVAEIGDEICAAFADAGVEGVYISNDIDGTDPLFALATGTPEPGGLHPRSVEQLIRHVASRYPIWGSDLVEVAPTVAGHSPREPLTTLGTAASYVETQARVMLDGPER